MKQKINLFPVLSKSLLNKAGYVDSDFSFQYIDDENYLQLKKDELENYFGVLKSIRLVDEVGHWDVKNHGLIIRIQIRFRNSHELFGENGVANTYSTIGIAAQILSKSSHRRELFTLGEINRKSNTFDGNYTFSLNKGEYSDNCIVRLVLYTKSIDKNSSIQFNEIQGRIIGVLSEVFISFKGEGSIFPIVEIDDLQSPLWTIYKNWGSPLEDEFQKDRIAVEINKSHVSYQLLTDGKNIVLNSFTREVISSAIASMITEIKDGNREDWDAIMSGTDLEPGTIAYVLQYFKSVHEWDFSSPIQTFKSIKSFFDEETVSK